MRRSPLFTHWIFFTWMLLATAHAQNPAAPSDIRSISASEFGALLDDARGEVILINLWATWCAPCLREIPELIRLRENYQDKGFRLMAVAMDDPQNLETHVMPFREQRFPDWDTFQRAEFEMDTFVSVVDPAWNEVLPTSYLIDRTGKVVKVLFGGKSYEDFEAALLEIL
jgi:thiol-disulfide isomerase/thioredoxin